MNSVTWERLFSLWGLVITLYLRGRQPEVEPLWNGRSFRCGVGRKKKIHTKTRLYLQKHQRILMSKNYINRLLTPLFKELRKMAILEGNFGKTICLKLSTSEKLGTSKKVKNCIDRILLHQKYLALKLKRISHKKQRSEYFFFRSI